MPLTAISTSHKHNQTHSHHPSHAYKRYYSHYRYPLTRSITAFSSPFPRGPFFPHLSHTRNVLSDFPRSFFRKITHTHTHPSYISCSLYCKAPLVRANSFLFFTFPPLLPTFHSLWPNFGASFAFLASHWGTHTFKGEGARLFCCRFYLSDCEKKVVKKAPGWK